MTMRILELSSLRTLPDATANIGVHKSEGRV